MLASEIRKEYLTPKEINVIISSSGLLTIVPFLEEVLNKSRSGEISAAKLLELQGKIAEKLIVIEKQINLFKKIADRSKQNNEWRSREIYKAQHRILKRVMDGVAFRFLNFNRPVLRQLVDHQQTGHLTQGFLVELEKAAYITEKTGFYVILNDLTNFLRYGDLTIISPEGYLMDEVKTTGKARGNQKKRLDTIIKNLNRGVYTIGNQSAQHVKVPGKPTHFFTQVEAIINKSKGAPEGIIADRISPYLWVSSMYAPKMQEYYKSNGKLPPLPSYPFHIRDISAPTNSLMFFGEFSPNIVPFTVFPFSVSNIVDLMTGQIQLKVVMSEKELIKSFQGKGWTLVMPNRRDLVSVYDADDINKIKQAVIDPRFFITLKKGRFSYKVPREILLRVESEFLSVKSIVEESEFLMSGRYPKLTEMLTTSFQDESSVWV